MSGSGCLPGFFLTCCLVWLSLVLLGYKGWAVDTLLAAAIVVAVARLVLALLETDP